MQAPADATKRLPPEDLAKAAKREKIDRELEEDAQIVLSGLRLMNRPRDNAKQRFIEDFRKSRAIDRFPVIDDDLVEESYVRWADDVAVAHQTMKDVLAVEIDKAFLQAGKEPPASSVVIATKILSSDTGANIGILADYPLAGIEVDLVLAHIASLGYRWNPRIAIAVARRTAIVILNRKKFEGGTACQ